MPYVTKRVVKKVTFIGHLDAETHSKAPSLNGPGVMVSDKPEHLRSVFGMNGPEVELFCPNAEWYDPLEMDQNDVEEIIAWGLMQNYIEHCAAWGVDYFDEDGDFKSAVCETQEEAARLAGRSLKEEIEASMKLEGATTELEHYRLRRRAMKLLGSWPDPLAYQDALVILYAREVILPKRPFYVGIWWEQPVDRAERTAPYGIIFPERLTRFEVETEDGDVLPFAKAFPDYPLPTEEQGSGIAQIADKMRREEQKLISMGYDHEIASRMAAARFLS